MLPDFPRFFPIFPDFSRCFWPKKDGKTRGKSRFSPILSRKFEDSDLDPIPICWKVGIGHPDPIPICWKIGIGHPDLDLDPTRPDFCRDLIPLEISRTWLPHSIDGPFPELKLWPFFHSDSYWVPRNEDTSHFSCDAEKSKCFLRRMSEWRIHGMTTPYKMADFWQNGDGRFFKPDLFSNYYSPSIEQFSIKNLHWTHLSWGN